MNKMLENEATFSSEERRAMLTQLLQKEIEQSHTFPLSFAQRRLWFLQQWEPASPAYNVVVGLHLVGQLDVTVLECSLNEIIRRHEILRTTFISREGEPQQVIASALTLPVAVVNLQVLPPARREASARQLAYERARRPFALDQEPALNVTLLQLAEHEYLLLVVVHHIVFDGWSKGIFIQELFTLYQSFLAGEPSPLPELAIQYADFVVWQHEWLQGKTLETLLAYWQKQLGGPLPVLELPYDRPRPALQTDRGDAAYFQLGIDLVQALQRLARSSGTTLFMTTLAAWAVLLSRYSHQTDIIIGSPVANRTRQELEPLMGFFVNTLALRLDLAGNPTFRQLLERVHAVTVQALEQQALPFEKLVESLHPERDPSRSPVFQVMFALQNAPAPSVELPELTLSPIEVETGTAKFDLVLYLTDTHTGLAGRLEYKTDLFDASTIARLVEHFQVLLAGIVAQPDQRLAELPLLTQAEQQQLLIEWNATQADYPESFIHQIFEAQVKKTPNAPAVIFENRRLTYQELDRQTNQLARYLQKLGIGVESLVGVCMERSVEMVVALLGTLKAGAAYVPMDPTYPADRLAFMLEGSQTPVLLAQHHLLEKLPGYTGRIICLDSEWSTIAQESLDPLAVKLNDDNLAYVIYTSGSTGRPKGAMNTHGGLRNRLLWMQAAYGLNETDRVLQKTPFSFDVSVWEFFWPLMTGAGLVVARPEGHKDSSYLVKLVIEQNITTMHFVPSMLQAWVEERELEACASLRRVICSGEALPFELQERFFQRLKHVELHNLYGPTEAAIDVTSWACQRDNREPLVPIGYPIANTQIYLLDAHLRPVPIGVPGELHIGGANLARGYLGRPELTAEKFIPNPFGAAGARLYKTGDLARYRADGRIEYLGRLDHQVKLRGFRIELGEIEAVLGQHPAVREVVLLARPDAAGDKRLVAYLVPKQAPAPGIVELRSFLKDKLPEYMVPSQFVILKTLPLTPSGKLDRRALPAPDTTRPELEGAFLAPRNPVEQTLADIWASVLGLDRVGVQDDFFALGGHSLQAVQLVSKIMAALGCPLSVKSIFLHPTIAALAQTLQIPRSEGALGQLAPQPASLPPALPHVKIENRSLLSLFAAGKIGPVDSAALSYLRRTKFTRGGPILDWFDGLPVCTNLLETAWGRIMVIFLPHFDTDLYVDEKHLIDISLEALQMAGRLGARVVSLTGLIPSATDYGRALAAAADKQALPAVSTGHATTTASVILTIKRILQEGGRDLAQERVGVLGLGSIGAASLRLMLRCLPHPIEIVLCDLYSKLEDLKRLEQEIRTSFGFQGTVRIAKAYTEIPPEFYQTTLMIGATNVPDVLDINRLNPGTLIVDDSGPHCFKTELAIRRFEAQGDILFTEGGVLQSPSPISELRYVPKEADARPELAEFKVVLSKGWRYNPANITGCVFSGLLSARFENLEPTVGLASVEACLQHYEKINQLGFQAAELHCSEYTLAPEIVRAFRSRFGK